MQRFGRLMVLFLCVMVGGALLTPFALDMLVLGPHRYIRILPVVPTVLGICGIVCICWGWWLWRAGRALTKELPEDRALHKEPQTAVEELRSFGDLDFGKLTLAGWLLLLITITTGVVGGWYGFSGGPGQFAGNRREIKATAFVFCILPMAGMYLLGRQYMKSKGWRMMRD